MAELSSNLPFNNSANDDANELKETVIVAEEDEETELSCDSDEEECSSENSGVSLPVVDPKPAIKEENKNADDGNKEKNNNYNRNRKDSQQKEILLLEEAKNNPNYRVQQVHVNFNEEDEDEVRTRMAKLKVSTTKFLRTYNNIMMPRSILSIGYCIAPLENPSRLLFWSIFWSSISAFYFDYRFLYYIICRLLRFLSS